MEIIKSIFYFVLAGLFEIGGGYLIWQWIREGKSIWYAVSGAILLVLYGVIPTLQPANFGRVYAAYGGIFIVLSILWGWGIDHKTVQTVEARPKVPGSEVPAYTLADGVDNAMRMSPDYLIVGEVRDGRAAMALLRTLMTGNAGACTLHADSPREAFERFNDTYGQ